MGVYLALKEAGRRRRRRDCAKGNLAGERGIERGERKVLVFFIWLDAEKTSET